MLGCCAGGVLYFRADGVEQGCWGDGGERGCWEVGGERGCKVDGAGQDYWGGDEGLGCCGVDEEQGWWMAECWRGWLAVGELGPSEAAGHHGLKDVG